VPAAAVAPTVSEEWLLRRYHVVHDMTAREELVRRMLPLARRVALLYGHPQHRDELLQVACLGLTKAIDRWDPRYGRPLRSYAVPTMRGEVRRWLRDHAWALHVPRPLQERVLAATRATDELTRRDGRAPTPAELAAHVGVELEEMLETLEAGRAYGTASIDTPLDGDPERRTLGETLGAPDGRLDDAEEVADLRRLRHLLDDREREVLRMRFMEDLTQMQIAQRVGCSQMQVSRILRRAVGRLREAAGA